MRLLIYTDDEIQNSLYKKWRKCESSRVQFQSSQVLFIVTPRSIYTQEIRKRPCLRIFQLDASKCLTTSEMSEEYYFCYKITSWPIYFRRWALLWTSSMDISKCVIKRWELRYFNEPCLVEIILTSLNPTELHQLVPEPNLPIKL